MRRTIAFLVHQGYSVGDLKTLYIDELGEYYYETIHVLEASGSLPEGSYDSARGIDRSSEVLETLFAKVRKQ